MDTKDIVELQLKQMDCEITIRKKEAIQQPLAAASVVAQPAPVSHAMLSPAPSAAPIPAPSAASAGSGPARPALPAPVKQSRSSHSPLKCPMAGTFYRSPAPGEPPFVKVTRTTFLEISGFLGAINSSFGYFPFCHSKASFNALHMNSTFDPITFSQTN